MQNARAWRLATIVAVMTLVATLVHSAFATHNLSLVTTLSGSGAKLVKIVRGTEGHIFTTAGFQDLEGASATLVAPAGSWHVLARFSAEAFCAPSDPSVLNYCRIRMLINGLQMLPNDGDLAFVMGSGAGAVTHEAHAIDQSWGPIGPGSYTVRVQGDPYAFSGAPPQFRLDDWTLTVELIRALP